MIRSIHRGMPAIPKGYALAPNASWFSVLTPIARTNLVINPSFEIDTTQYGVTGASISRVATQQYHGAYSLQITPSAGVGSNGAYHGPIALTSAQLYACSCKFLGVAGVGYKIAVDDTSNAEIVSYRFVATGRWQWVWLYYLETSSTNRRFAFKKNNNASVAPFYVDGVQVEAIAAGEAVSTYIDGDQAGLVPNQFPPAYVWTGTPHGSTSTRSSQTRAGGVVMRLDYYGFVLLAMLGLGVPTPSNVSVPYALLDGAQYERTQKPPRGFTLGGRWDNASFPQLQRQIGDLGAALDRDAVGQQQPLTLLYQALDSCDSPISDPARIVCSYQGGLEGVTDNLHAEQASIVFKTWMPLIQGDGESGAALSVQLSVANANDIMQRSATGVWSALGTGGNGTVLALAAGPDGTIYAGGNFTSMGGVANTTNIAYWDGSAWHAMGTGVSGGSGVSAIAVGPDGSVYVGGDFTAMGGVANTARIAKWNGAAWSALSTGMNGGVYGLALGKTGILYATGNFTTAGGVGSMQNTAQWNGSAWATVGTGLTPANGLALVVGPDGTLYAGGQFTSAGVPTVNFVAKWNGTVWSVLSTGMNNEVDALAVGASGIVYAGGQFTTASGVAAQDIAQWNGVAWAPVGSGSGLNSTVWALAAGNGAKLYAGGSFTTANGITLPDRMAQWTGATWTAMDVDLPGSPQVRAFLPRPDGSLYVGYSTTGTATAAATTTITNPGTANAYPTLTIKGPATGTSRIYQLVNTTTGRAIYLNLTINAGETVTLSFAPDNLSFTSTFQGNVANTILPGSNEADFFLSPGANVISFFSADNTVTATMRFRPQYVGVGDLTP